MASGNISPAVRKFIQDSIHSVQQLEVLMALVEAGAEMSADEIAARIGLPVTAVANRLMNLWAKGLVSARENDRLLYRFQAKSPAVQTAVDELRAAYAQARLEVMELINTRADSELRSFSDAFRIKKEETDNG